MYKECEKYFIDADEKHLGKIEECKLIADEYEVEDAIIDRLHDDCDYPSDWKFYFPDENTGYDIEIDASEYIDVEMITEYFDSLEDDELIDIIELYARADVTMPKFRSKK